MITNQSVAVDQHHDHNSSTDMVLIQSSGWQMPSITLCLCPCHIDCSRGQTNVLFCFHILRTHYFTSHIVLYRSTVVAAQMQCTSIIHHCANGKISSVLRRTFMVIVSLTSYSHLANVTELYTIYPSSWASCFHPETLDLTAPENLTPPPRMRVSITNASWCASTGNYMVVYWCA